MKDRAYPTVGASALLVIFCVLCLVVFALLSVSAVKADERLSDSAGAAIAGYYEADGRAEQILSALRSGQIPQGVTEENGIYSYSCAISDTQVLAVQVAVQGTKYEILRWQAVSITGWQPEDTLPVWDGQ